MSSRRNIEVTAMALAACAAALAACAAVLSMSTTSKAPEANSKSRQNWATVTTKHMDCQAASHAGCLVPIVDNTEGWGGSVHTLNVAASKKDSPYCHFGNDAITSGCWPSNGARIVVHCKMPGSVVQGRGSHRSDVWYKVILPETTDGKRVWLQPKLGESMGDSAFGWVSSLWLSPERPVVDCQE